VVVLHIVLFAPQIPQKHRQYRRMCALSRSRLHLVHPLGFRDQRPQPAPRGHGFTGRRSTVHEHADWPAFRASPHAPKRLWLFTTKTARSFWDVRYLDGDGLVFGNEGEGPRPGCTREIGDAQRVTIPHANPDLRSLNLSTAAGIACFEALRQWR